MAFITYLADTVGILTGILAVRMGIRNRGINLGAELEALEKSMKGQMSILVLAGIILITTCGADLIIRLVL